MRRWRDLLLLPDPNFNYEPKVHESQHRAALVECVGRGSGSRLCREVGPMVLINRVVQASRPSLSHLLDSHFRVGLWVVE
jgi:hypothetical protein